MHSYHIVAELRHFHGVVAWETRIHSEGAKDVRAPRQR
jgi:hypothetical protein